MGTIEKRSMDAGAVKTRVAADYSNHLLDACPQRLAVCRRIGILAVLVLVCLAVRGAMALRIPAVNPDSIVYVHSARAWEAGDAKTATRELGLNVYPVILMLLHRAGLDWELAGTLWGVVISSLVVLPMFGWVRRQFDDRVALAACFLYAVQPKMIEWAPEIMRDPTFWFVLMLSIYLLWRAVTEVALGWFLAFGLAMAIAVLTRFEGLLLVILLLLWTFWRFRALQSGRGRLLLGALLGVAAFPLLGFLLSMAITDRSFGELWLRLDIWARFEGYFQWLTGHLAAGGKSYNPLLPADEASLPVSRMVWMFVPTLTRGLSPLWALLMFGGIWGWRHVWRRRDHQAPFWAGTAILVAIWVQLWFDRAICPRYALPIVLLGSPFAALGLLGLTDRLTGWAARFGVPVRMQAAVVVLPLVVVAAIGIADSMTCNRGYFASRKLAADLGRWLAASKLSDPMLVGPVALTPIVSFYADKGRYEQYRMDSTSESTITNMVAACRPDLLLLRTTKRIDAEQCGQLAERFKAHEFREIDPVVRPPLCDPLVILVRRPDGANVPLLGRR